MSGNVVIHRSEVSPAGIRQGDIGREVLVLQATPNMVSGITRVYPHARTRGHAHPNREEHYYVLAGAGYLLLDDERYEIRAGDCVSVPPVSLHTIVNPGDEVLEFFWAAFPDEPKIEPKGE